jgi:hypothetical protein
VTMHGLCAVCYASQGSPEAELTLVFLIEKALGHNSASHTQGPSPASIALLCLSNVNTAQSVGSLCHEHRPDAVLCCAMLWMLRMCVCFDTRQASRGPKQAARRSSSSARARRRAARAAALREEEVKEEGTVIITLRRMRRRKRLKSPALQR